MTWKGEKQRHSMAAKGYRTTTSGHIVRTTPSGNIDLTHCCEGYSIWPDGTIGIKILGNDIPVASYDGTIRKDLSFPFTRSQDMIYWLRQALQPEEEGYENTIEKLNKNYNGLGHDLVYTMLKILEDRHTGKYINTRNGWFKK